MKYEITSIQTNSTEKSVPVSRNVNKVLQDLICVRIQIFFFFFAVSFGFILHA